MQNPVLMAFCLFLAGQSMGQAKTDTAGAYHLPSDEEIRQLLINRIDTLHKCVGMVVGITTPQGRRLIYYGHPDLGDRRTVDENTVFEIGSITKLFTALLLADMVERKEVALDDPAKKYLSKGIKVPERNGHYITLADLATHTSGLPYIPDNMGFDLAKPGKYSKKEIYDLSSQYTDEKFYQFLSVFTLSRDIGSGWEYSNVDYGLLGKALAGRTGLDYETLVRKRITGPLRMRGTAITVSAKMKKRLGSGHDVNLQPTPDISMPTMEAAGSLRSTASDLLTLLEVFTQYRQSRLSGAAKGMLDIRRPGPGFQQALGWWLLALGPGQDSVALFGGETLGYTSTIAFDPKMRIGVVVLTNSDQTDGGLCLHILRPSFPMETSSKPK